ncbi:MAG: Fe-S cluster assembly protein SufB [Flavobacteriaceae bacterium TMED171]|nr:MAG: Fe-S cluster assembly protein SufB [Flavobacteriaceae bacterium TMED171]|tara:strand:- start:1148 stop:2587 length:1440 start_codon:yes stop_codon:yes gene_type:complete
MSEALDQHLDKKYEQGFITEVESNTLPPGLDETTVEKISQFKKEPQWLLDWRLKAYRRWLKMEAPKWSELDIEPIDYQAISYYSAPKPKLKSMDEVDPEVLATFEKLGIPTQEQAALAGVAVDAVFDSVSVATTFKDDLAKQGIIFCSFGEAVQEHPELVKKYLGSVIPITDNYFACLNSAVFTDGSFCYIPKGVRCPMELSTYFRINQANTGQFERTLIIAEDDSYVSYLEGCTAPARDENQLHAACVEIVAMDRAEVKYSTVQNWYPGDPETGKGGVYNFVTKRAMCKGYKSRVTWTQVETGSALTWKYPSCVLRGDESQGEFYSVAVSTGKQQADTGTKMIHLGKNTTSTIISKGISAKQGKQTYRGLVKMKPRAGNSQSKNFTQCDSMLIGNQCAAITIPYIENEGKGASLNHEATTSKVSEEMLFYLRQRGLDEEQAMNLIVNGFVKEVVNRLPMEFAVEANKLLEVTLEGSVG